MYQVFLETWFLFLDSYLWDIPLILSGNKLGSPVEAIGNCILILSSDFIFEIRKDLLCTKFFLKLDFCF